MRLLTTDIYEGAYLISHGLSLIKIWRKDNGKRSVIFEFDGDTADLLRNKYEKGEAVANVSKLKQSLNELKDRMFNLIRNDEIENRGEKNYEHNEPELVTK